MISEIKLIWPLLEITVIKISGGIPVTWIYNSIVSWVSRHPVLSLVLGGCLIATYTVAATVAGVVAQKRHYPERLEKRFTSFIEKWSDDRAAHWAKKVTNIHTLEIARVRIGNALGNGGGLEEVAGNILFVSSKGRFGYLDNKNSVHSLDFLVPMNLEVLRQSPHYEDPLFYYNSIRVMDMLAVQTGPKHFNLYVSHHFFKPDCLQFKVSSIEIQVDEKGIRAKSPNWKEVFIARPHCIRNKDRSWRFVGEAGGGRLVQLDSASLLLSIGDHQFDGFNDAWAASMDPQTDLGKIIKIDLGTHQSRIYATGVRNPQGLTVARDGRVWETEHGPQGGDEVNLIRDGANYGWPIVTYGMNYGYPRRKWPFNPVPGAHNGYTPPAFAFVPSIGMSNIVEPDPEEFPNWRHKLIATSLRGNKLLLLAIEGDRIAYAEPISADRDRIRDIISLRNGQLVYLSDTGDLVFIRNAERRNDDQPYLSISALSSLSNPLPEELPPRTAGPVGRGRHMFLGACASCHALDGSIGVGPPLNGVVGRRVGSVSGFGYSQALSGYDGTWTHDLLTSFLTDPDRYFHGTTMATAPISWAEVPNVASFLETTRSSPMQEKERTAANADRIRKSVGP